MTREEWPCGFFYVRGKEFYKEFYVDGVVFDKFGNVSLGTLGGFLVFWRDDITFDMSNQGPSGKRLDGLFYYARFEFLSVGDDIFAELNFAVSNFHIDEGFAVCSVVHIFHD